MYCLQCFSLARVLEEHMKDCLIINGTHGSILEFTDYHKGLPAPFVIYADFEAINEKVLSCQSDPHQSYTQTYQKHTDCGYAYKVVCHYDDRFTKPVLSYRGPGAVRKFLEKIMGEVHWCNMISRDHFNKLLRMTRAQEMGFELEDHFHICERKYTEEDVRVRDHCHVTGKYRDLHIRAAI